jgi:prepilin signal peptidase PulO-like enzyme (type II secretory pathway)
MNVNIVMLILFWIMNWFIFATIMSHIILKYERDTNVDNIYINKEKRSICENCKKTLSWYHIIPIISYIFLNWKCWYCWNKIKSYYFRMEIMAFCIWLWLNAIAAWKNIYNLYDIYINNIDIFIYQFIIRLVISWFIFWFYLKMMKKEEFWKLISTIKSL